MNEISTRIVEGLEQRKWSQAELGRRVGVSSTTVGMWISGQTAPTRKNFPRLASVLSWPTSTFDHVDLSTPKRVSSQSHQRQIAKIENCLKRVEQEIARLRRAVSHIAGEAG